MSEHFHQNYGTLESGRLTTAILFSLVLHILLLFFIRFAQPSSESPASRATSLNVILEKRIAEVAKPAGIPEASEASRGEAKVGVQEMNSFPLKTLTAVTHAQVDQSRTEIPKTFISEKILTLKKPAKITMVESEPDLLVIKSASPEATKNEDMPFAPTPSVDNSVTSAIPPLEKLVSPESTPGEKQEKIVVAESAQEKPIVEKPVANVEGSRPVKIKEPEPVKIEEPKPVKIKEPEPVKVEEPKPVKVKDPEPVKVEEPKPVKVKEPEPVKVEEPKPVKVKEPEPAKTEEQKPAKTEKPIMAEAVAEPNIFSSERVKSDVFRKKLPGGENPSLAELSFASVRKLSVGEEKRIKFGERRKTIDFKEQELRYAMYVEGVRLKLERIGFFNYPVAASRNNQTGTLSIKISISSDGSLEDFSISRPSMYESLNAGAERIVRMSAPFSPLPDDIKKDTDILSITINWTFSNSRQSLD